MATSGRKMPRVLPHPGEGLGRVANQPLAQRLDALSAPYELTDRLYRANSLDEVYEAALDVISKALGCERASIQLYDDAGVMRFVAWRGFSDAYRKAVEGHSPWQADEKDPQILCVPDLSTADLASDLRAVVKAEGIRALAFIPLVARGKLIGKFMTYHSAPHRFSDAEIGLSVSIARQLGFSIERQRTEEARECAEQANRLMASVINSSSDAILSHDLEGRITSWNQGATEMYGYSAKKMIGQNFELLVPPEFRERALRVNERIRRGEEVEPYESAFQSIDGDRIDLSMRVSPIHDHTGKVIGISRIARDITKRKRAQGKSS